MIIRNNFQRLYSPCTQTKTQIVFTINGYSVPINKLNKAYTRQKIKFTRNQRGERVIPAGQEELCKKIYSDNPLKFWDKDKIFAKITLLNPNTIS